MARPKLWIIGSIVTTVILLACGSGQGSSDDPEAVVAQFYARLERFDTAGMVELVCVDQQEDFESGLGLLQSLIGLGGVTGVSVQELTLEDFDARTLDVQGDSATVEVSGRLNAGPPLGSTDLSDEIPLRRESGHWCLADQALTSSEEPRSCKQADIRFESEVQVASLESALRDLGIDDYEIKPLPEYDFAFALKLPAEFDESLPQVGPAPQSRLSELARALVERFGRTLDAAGNSSTNFIAVQSIDC